MRTLMITALLAVCAGCAPTTLGPMVMRLTPGDPDALTGRVGLRTGPRLTTPFSVQNPAPGAPFAGDSNIFSIPQWGMAYDLSLTKPITPETSLHLGGQAEFYSPFPLPAYGLYTGVSHYLRFGRASLAPALMARFATDFGIHSTGGPGTLLGGELSTTLGWHPEDRVAVGLAPFASYQHLWASTGETGALYVGAALVARMNLGADAYELSGGFGRVFTRSGLAWNVPIIGVSVGH